MVVSPQAIEDYLDRPVPPAIPFKGMSREDLLDLINASANCEPYVENGTKLRPYQLEALAFALYYGNGLLFLDMQLGKACANETKVATPNGWVRIDSLRPGDLVISHSGKPVRVTGVFPQGTREMFRVEFTDGAWVDCDADHLWTVTTPVQRHRLEWAKTKTLRQIQMEGLYVSKNERSGWKHFIPVTEPVEYPFKNLLVDPYLLGVLLGDGCLVNTPPSVTTDEEIVDSLYLPPDTELKKYGHPSEGVVDARFPHGPLKSMIIHLGLWGRKSYEKFIPTNYLVASINQRRALLAGLLDTDGGMCNKNTVFWSTSSPQLAADMQELVRSFGGTAKINTKQSPKYPYKGEIRTGRPSYSIAIQWPPHLGNPFRLRRKAAKWAPLTKFLPTRAITSITPISHSGATCIAIDSNDGLFLVKDYIVTHNTIVALRWAEQLRKARMWRRKGLIVAHAPIGLQVWEREAEKHSSLKIASVQYGIGELINALESDADLIAIPWTGLQQIFTVKRVATRGKRAGQAKRYVDLAMARDFANEFSLCIFDEIHRAKDQTSLWFHTAATLTEKTRFRLGLTGTPTGREPFGLWAQSYLIDHGHALGESYYFFEQAFGWRQKIKTHPRGFVWRFRKRRMPQLMAKLQALTFAYNRSEVAPRDIQPRLVDLRMSKPQIEAYQHVLDDIVATARDEGAPSENNFVKLRQIASGFLPHTNSSGEERMVEFPASTKLEWLESALDELDDRQVVIFHDFIQSGKMICRLLTRKRISHRWIWGGGEDNAAAVRDFQNQKAQVLVANAATGGMSINLSNVDYLWFYECPLSSITRQQAEARPLADREQRPLWVTDLICSGVERRILEMIREGKTVRASLMRPRDLLV